MELFSGSRAGRLTTCPASGRLDELLPGWIPPQKHGTAAALGTKAHSVLQHWLELPKHLRDHMAEAFDYVDELRSQRRYKMLTEETLKAEWLTTRPSTTPDVVLYLKDELHVLDFKTGGTPVEAGGNMQLIFLAITLLEAGYAPDATKVTLHIVQPWADNMDSVIYTIDELKQFRRQLQQAELEYLQGSLRTQVSEYCQLCPANPAGKVHKGNKYCPTALEFFYPRDTFTEEDINDLLE